MIGKAVEEIHAILQAVKTTDDDAQDELDAEAAGFLKVICMWFAKEAFGKTRTFEEWIRACQLFCESLEKEPEEDDSRAPPPPPPLPSKAPPPPPPLPNAKMNAIRPSLEYVCNERVPRGLLIPSSAAKRPRGIFSSVLEDEELIGEARDSIPEESSRRSLCRRIHPHDSPSTDLLVSGNNRQRSASLVHTKEVIIDAHRMTMVGIFRSKLHPNTFPELLQALPSLTVVQLSELAHCLPTETEKAHLDRFFSSQSEGSEERKRLYADEWFMWQTAQIGGFDWMIAATRFLLELPERTAVLKRQTSQMRNALERFCKCRELRRLVAILWRLWELANCRFAGVANAGGVGIAGFRIDVFGRMPSEAPWIGECVVQMAPRIPRSLYLGLFGMEEVSRSVPLDWDLQTMREEWRELQQGVQMLRSGPLLSAEDDEKMASARRFHQHLPLDESIDGKMQELADLMQALEDSWTACQEYLQIRSAEEGEEGTAPGTSPKQLLAAIHTFVCWLIDLQEQQQKAEANKLY